MKKPNKKTKVTQSLKKAPKVGGTINKKSRFSIDVLCCPVCYVKSNLKQTELGLNCSVCNRSFPIVDDVPHLLPNINAKTKLENIDYDEVHAINEKARTKIYQQWEEIFKSYNANKGSILEIGSGTGNITASLVNNSNFSQVHSCDISQKFLNSIEKNYCITDEAKNKINFYICDANQLPFAPESFDVVMGHSVLHHFLYYKRTIKRSYDALKPGGIAAFYEPVIQGKILIAFFIDLMLKFQENSLKIFSNEEVQRMRKMVSHITKASRIKEKTELASMEDKYIFDITELSGIAAKIGFKSFASINHGGVNSTAIRGYKPYVISTLLMINIPKEKIQHFDFMFDSFAETLSDLIGDQLVTPMVYLVFQK